MASEALPDLSSFQTSKDFSDITILVGDVAFPCHRIILASASKFFHAMLIGHFEESSAAEVPLSDIDSAVFEVLLTFMYTGELMLTRDNAFKLLTTSEYLLMPFVVEKSVLYLMNNLPTDESVIDILMYAVHRGDKNDLKTRTTAIIAQNFCNLSKVDKLLTVPFEILIKMFQLIQFQKEPDSLLEFVSRWTRASPGREDSVETLLKEFNLKNTISVSIPFMTKLLLTQQLNPSAETESKENKSNVAELDLIKDRNSISYKHVMPAKRKKLEVYVEDCNGSVISCYLDEEMNKWSGYREELIMHKEARISTFQTVVVNQLYHLMYSLYNDSSEKATMFFDTHSDYETGRSVSLLPLDDGIRYYTIAATDSVIYLFCREKYENLTSHFVVYDCMANQWYPVPEPVEHKWTTCITTMGHLLYAFGGETKLSVSEFRCENLSRHKDWRRRGSKYASSYDRRSGKWNKLPEMLSGRACAAACAHDGKLYVSGGFSENSVEVFDPVASKWSFVKPMPHIRFNHRMVSFNNHLWILSGMRNKNWSPKLSFKRRRNSCEKAELLFQHYPINQNWTPTMRFNPVINDWSKGPSLEAAVCQNISGGKVKFLNAVVR